MQRKILLLLAIVSLVLAACGQKKIDESLTLVDQNNNEVILPQDKPTLFFFMTTYT